MEHADQIVSTEFIDTSRAMLQSGKTQENVIAFLKEKGCSKVQSIRVLMVVSNLGLQHAKQVVDHSPTWHDRKGADDDLHRTLERLQG